MVLNTKVWAVKITPDNKFHYHILSWQVKQKQVPDKNLSF